MAKILRVRAGANGPVVLPAPIQGARTIGDDAIEVESTAFIRRRIEVGDLVLVGEDEDDGVADEEQTKPGGGAGQLAADTYTSESVASGDQVHTSTPKPAPVRRRPTSGEKE